jgi:hypothetical protein
MMTGYILQLLTSKDNLLHSGGATTELSGLAKRVLLKYNPSGLLVLSEQWNLLPDYYVAPDNRMEKILNQYSVEPLSLDEQIENTGHAIAFS